MSFLAIKTKSVCAIKTKTEKCQEVMQQLKVGNPRKSIETVPFVCSFDGSSKTGSKGEMKGRLGMNETANQETMEAVVRSVIAGFEGMHRIKNTFFRDKEV